VAVATLSAAKCRGTRIDGKPCESQIVGPSGCCYAHDPTVAEDRAKARRRGGLASSAISRTRRLAPAALRDVYTILERALAEVHSGVLSAGQATAMASLARAMCHVLSVGEMEQRLRSLEESLGDFQSL
jgi:hypothetical protein